MRAPRRSRRSDPQACVSVKMPVPATTVVPSGGGNWDVIPISWNLYPTRYAQSPDASVTQPSARNLNVAKFQTPRSTPEMIPESVVIRNVSKKCYVAPTT